MTTIARGILFVLAVGIVSAATAFAKPRPPLTPPSENLPVLWQANFDSPLYSKTNRADVVATDFGTLVSGSSGYALQRSGSPVTPFLVPALDATGHTNVACGADGGALRFWLSSHRSPDSAPGVDGWLAGLAAIENGTNALIAWSLQVSADGSTLSLLAPSDSGPSTLLSAPIAWDAQSAHCVALNFGPETALFIDGQLVATGLPTAALPPQFAQLVLGSDFSGGNTPNCDLDEIYSFASPLADTSSYYQATASQMTLGPITPEAIAARLRTLVHPPTPQRMLGRSLNMMSLSLFPPPSTNPPPSRPPFPPTSTNGLQGVAYSQLPTNGGSFWRLQRHTPPLPFDKFPDCPVFLLDNGSYLIDDSGISYPEPSDSGGPAGGPPATTNSYSSSDFFLTISQITNGTVTVILHNTTNGQPYTLMSRETLAPGTPWLVEQDMIGASNQNWTAAQVPFFGRRTLFFQAHTGPDSGARVFFLEITGITSDSVNLQIYSTAADQIYDIVGRQSVTAGEWVSQGTFTGLVNWTPATIARGAGDSLFLRARNLSLDADGNGIPDWWEIKYFGTNGIDPYLDLLNNGWSVLNEYLAGLNPLATNQPPAPQGLTATYSNTVAIVAWNFSLGGVTGYKLQKYDPVSLQTNDITLPATTNSYVDSALLLLDDELANGPPLYRAQAQYGAVASAWAGWIPLYKPDPNQSLCSGYFIRGPQGQPYLAIPPLPQNASIARIIFANAFSGSDTSWTVPAASFTNNRYALPEQLLPANVTEGNWFVEIRDAADKLLGTIRCGYAGFQNTPFYDGRQQLQQNLSFVLRAADAVSPFQFTWTGGSTAWFFGCDSRFAVASYVDLVYPDPDFPILNETSPFIDNYCYRNFAYSTNDLDWSGILDSADYDQVQGFTIPNHPVHEFPGPANGAQIDAVLSPTDFPWTFFRPYSTTDTDELSRIGTTYGPDGLTLSPNAYNFFGLRFDSLQAPYPTNGTLRMLTFGRGQTVPDYGSILYPATELPILVTTNYYFARPWYDPLPGDGAFSPTNTSPLLIAGIGQPYWLAGYAKQAISNGDPTKFGYLGQYFSGAYKIAPNGEATTNQTGILSEYGEFFPTEPGPTALITMTNWGVNEHGTAIVNVVSLCVDANHDGTMDQTLYGSDSTSFLRPFRFWINNDRDLDGYNSGIGQDTEGAPDCADFRIGSQRDLEDLARLWICGVPVLTNSGYQITLSWANVSNGNPAINLFRSVETNGGIAYLTNTAVAAAQTESQSSFAAPAWKIGTVSTAQTYTFAASFFTNGANRYLLFEGAGIGSGELVLTIQRNGQTIARTSAWLDLRDVKDMFDHAHIENAPASPPYSALTDVSTYVEDSSIPVQDGDGKQMIVFVHGWRLTPWVAENFAQTMYKRLWWQGYQGRFATLHWPTLSSETDGPVAQFLTFNRDEYIAFNCAQGAANYFLHLQNRFPDYSINVCAHSHGNILMMESLRRHLAAGQTPIHNYALLQAAVAGECLDTNAPVFLGFVLASPQLPDSFYGYGSSIRDAISGHMANFYNTNDFGVVTCWQPDQLLLKPDNRYFYQYLPQGPYQTPIGSARLITDPHELMAFLSRPRTQAVGAMADLAGPLSPSRQQDLRTLVGFRGNWDEHSGEFNWNIQRLNAFYRALLDQLVK